MALLVVASLRATCRAPGLPFTTSGLRVAGRRVRIAAGAGVAVAAAVTGSHGDSFVIADGVRGMVVGGGGEGHHEGYEEEEEEGKEEGGVPEAVDVVLGSHGKLQRARERGGRDEGGELGIKGGGAGGGGGCA